MAQPFNNQGWGLLSLHLKQGRATVLAGAVDVTDHVDIHGLIGPWTQFSDLAFGVSPPIGVANRSGLGVAAGAMATDNLYVVAGLADDNVDPTGPEEGFNAKVRCSPKTGAV
jgi:porin